MTKQIDNTFTIREKVVIRLLSFLISFIGKKLDEYYEHKLDSCLHEIFYPKSEENE